MSYLEFHLVFILPPLAVLARRVRERRRDLPPRAGLFLGLMALIALVYATPWDNYLVRRGVWSYGPDRVLGTLGYVPVEEYLFFVLQPLLAGLWLFWLVQRRPGSAAGEAPARSPRRVRAAGAAVYFALALLGALLLRSPSGTYLGLILAWAAPVLGLQWAYAGGEVWRRRRLWLLAVAAPTLYLWVADAVAIRLGIWSISPELSTGLVVLGLPVEEAVFFLVTNLLVVQGMVLFLWPPRRDPSSSAIRYPLSAIRSGTGPSAAAAAESVADSRADG